MCILGSCTTHTTLYNRFVGISVYSMQSRFSLSPHSFCAFQVTCAHSTSYRKLTVDVSNSDRRYMPKTITVEGGGSGQLKELSTVSIPLEANGTFVLLEDQTESYNVIRVCVKESHSVSVYVLYPSNAVCPSIFSRGFIYLRYLQLGSHLHKFMPGKIKIRLFCNGKTLLYANI